MAFVGFSLGSVSNVSATDVYNYKYNWKLVQGDSLGENVSTSLNTTYPLKYYNKKDVHANFEGLASSLYGYADIVSDLTNGLVFHRINNKSGNVTFNWFTYVPNETDPDSSYWVNSTYNICIN